MKGHIPRSQKKMVGLAIAQIVSALNAAEARQRFDELVADLQCSAAKVAVPREVTEDDRLVHMMFPAQDWSKLRSANPLERLKGRLGSAVTWSASTRMTPA